MKKLIIPVVGLTLTLVSCSSEEEETNDSLGRLRLIGSDSIDDYDVRVFVDDETGCQYMATFGNGKVMMPMLQADGKPYCPKNK